MCDGVVHAHVQQRVACSACMHAVPVFALVSASASVCDLPGLGWVEDIQGGAWEVEWNAWGWAAEV